MKLNQAKVKCLSAASADGLTSSVTAWLEQVDGEAQLVSLEYSSAVGVFSVLIVYAT